MTNVYDLIGRTRGPVTQVGQTRGPVAQVGRTRGDLAFVGVSDVLDLGGAAAPEDSAVMWVTADQGVTGTGAEVDSWATRSDSGLTLAEAGTGKPLVRGRRVDMDNVPAQINWFTGGSTATLQAVTETADFAFAWRGTFDAYDGAFSTIQASLVHTRTTTGRGCNLFVYGSGANLAFSTWNTAGTPTNLIWTGWGGYYTMGDPVDIVILGDGTDLTMYVDGVLRATVTAVKSAGAHALAPVWGRLQNTTSAAIHIGSVEGIFYDEDSSQYTVEEARALVTVSEAAVPFSPYDITSLAEYLDARVLAATLTDGDPVATWPSGVSGGIDGTQGTTAARPSWLEAGIGTEAALDLDGTDDRIRWDVESAGTTYTLSWLLSADDFSATGSVFDSTSGRLFVRINSSTGAVVVFAGASQVTTAATLTAATGCLLTIRFRGADSECDVWIDDTEVAQGVSYTPTSLDGATRLGSSNSGGSTYFDGKLAAAMLFDDALTDVEIQDLWTYFSTEWGL